MTDPLHAVDDAAAALDIVHHAAAPYLASLPDRLVRDVDAERLLTDLDIPLEAVGTLESIRALVDVGVQAATQSSGPRFYHFVCGGSTPAAMAGDWLTALLDQVSGLWASSPLASHLETIVLGWLKELFGLPASYGGVLTPSATFANLTGLACARHWWADRHGVDVAADGLAGLPRMPVIASGLVHPSARKALQLLGCGRDTVQVCGTPNEPADLDAIAAALRATDGPAVVIANAGDVNTGAFDPIAGLADLAEQHDAWLHVDGAFGLFAALSPTTAELVRGVERADSIAADGHKWLNVPYESGFAFVRDPAALGRTFGAWGAPYLISGDETRIDYNCLGPESSRRARSLPIWATLRAYGRDGYRAMVERHVALARHLGDRVTAHPELELLAPVQLCVVCFRYAPEGVGDLDALNAELGRRIVEDGRVYLGTTVYRGMTALRPAIVNWRTTQADIDFLADVVLELGKSITG